MVKFLSSILLVAVLGVSTLVEGQYGRFGGGRKIKEIRFYQQQVCTGHHYAITLGRNEECKEVPSWLTEEGWNLSVDPLGNCIQLYEEPNCRESRRPVSYAFSPASARDELVRRCRSTKELGFRNGVRSFRAKQC